MTSVDQTVSLSPTSSDTAVCVSPPPLTLRRRLIPIEPEGVMQEASRKAGLSNFGDDSFREALAILCQSYNHSQTELGVAGRFFVRRELVNSLYNRLLIVETLRRHPHIQDVPLRRPLVVTGLMRTGTTLLHRLLACADGGWYPHMWQLRTPAPSPAASFRYDRRRIAGMVEMWVARLVIPHFEKIHSLDPDQAEECVLLLRNSLYSMVMEPFAHIPAYSQWLRSTDPLPHYQFYRSQLQILMLNAPSGFPVLKAPGHLYGIKGLMQTFPDAHVVFTHRNLDSVVASTCSLYQAVRQLTLSRQAPHLLGKQVLHDWSCNMEKAISERQFIPEQQQVDIAYRALVKDPVGTAMGILEQFGYPTTNTTRSRMEAYMAEHPQHQKGHHTYELADFGLTHDHVAQSFAPYLARFAHLL